MNTFTLRLLTPSSCLFHVALWLLRLLDGWTDNDATISKLFLWIAAHAPITSLCSVLGRHPGRPSVPAADPLERSILMKTRTPKKPWQVFWAGGQWLLMPGDLITVLERKPLWQAAKIQFRNPSNLERPAVLRDRPG